MNTKELDVLIKYIYDKFKIINNNWEKNNNYKPINMKKNTISDIINNNEKLDIIFEYRNYILNLYNELVNEIAMLNLKNKVEIRVKAYSSLQMERYL